MKLQEKFEIVKKLKSKVSQRKIAFEFGNSVAEVNTISKKNKEIITAFETNKLSEIIEFLKKKLETVI